MRISSFDEDRHVELANVRSLGTVKKKSVIVVYRQKEEPRKGAGKNNQLAES